MTVRLWPMISTLIPFIVYSAATGRPRRFSSQIQPVEAGEDFLEPRPYFRALSLMLGAFGAGAGLGFVKTLFAFSQPLRQLLVLTLQLLDSIDRCLDSLVELLKRVKGHSRWIFHFHFIFGLIELSSCIRTAGRFGARFVLRKQRFHEFARLEGAQIFYVFAHADEAHGQFKLLGYRDYHAALGGTVELRQHHAGKRN